ncbi:MAG TPA: hypothetical protein EYQ74_12025 [Planctomycetes bacterium]|nr:hypothetical protein [Planctomycetota bacterium]HIK61708.1 hypothetical protein [Planctomycetota bacterium]
MQHHRRGLRRLVDDEALLNGLEAEHLPEDFPPRLGAMVDYALKLTREPSSMERSDVETLEAAGFDHGAVLAIAEVTAYYAYVNRIADGLGVELESD